MAITASQVKELRDKTGSGMMDCKKALVEADGNLEKAIEILRKKGASVAAKRAERDVNEGVVLTKVLDNGNTGVILQVNCETDFVANNEDFAELGKELCSMALENSSEDITDEMKTKVTDTISIIKENISLKRVKKIDISEDELVMDYIHGGGSIGILVKLKSEKKEA